MYRVTAGLSFLALVGFFVRRYLLHRAATALVDEVFEDDAVEDREDNERGIINLKKSLDQVRKERDAAIHKSCPSCGTRTIYTTRDSLLAMLEEEE